MHRHTHVVEGTGIEEKRRDRKKALTTKIPQPSLNRSSSTNPFAGLAEYGGVNSIRQFSRSWQRASIFQEVLPQRPNFAFAPDQEPAQHHDGIADPNQHYHQRHHARDDDIADVEAAGPRASLLRQHLEAAGDGLSGSAVVDSDSSMAADPASHLLLPHAHEAERKRSGGSDLYHVLSSSGGSLRHRHSSIFEVPPHLAVPSIVGSYESYRSYGTVDSDASRPSMAHAADLWRQQQESGANVLDGERPPILVKEVEQEGRIVLAVSGQSTLPQTVMNATK